MSGPQREINERMHSILYDVAQFDEDVQLARSLKDARRASIYEGELLSGNQLADLMGIKRDDTGQVPITPFFNACLDVTEVPGIRSLPDDQRIQAIATAFRAIQIILTRRS